MSDESQFELLPPNDANTLACWQALPHFLLECNHTSATLRPPRSISYLSPTACASHSSRRLTARQLNPSDSYSSSYKMTSRPKPPPAGQPQQRKQSWRQGKVNVFQRKEQGPSPAQEQAIQEKRARDVEAARQRDPKTTRYIEHDGESGRSWFNPVKFVTICAKSSCKASMLTNILWPFTIAAMVLHFHYN